MVEWHHQLNGHEFEQTLGNSERQGRLLQFMGSQTVRHELVTERQRHLLTAEFFIFISFYLEKQSAV